MQYQAPLISGRRFAACSTAIRLPSPSDDDESEEDGGHFETGIKVANANQVGLPGGSKSDSGGQSPSTTSTAKQPTFRVSASECAADGGANELLNAASHDVARQTQHDSIDVNGAETSQNMGLTPPSKPSAASAASVATTAKHLSRMTSASRLKRPHVKITGSTDRKKAIDWDQDLRVEKIASPPPKKSKKTPVTRSSIRPATTGKLVAATRNIRPNGPGDQIDMDVYSDNFGDPIESTPVQALKEKEEKEELAKSEVDDPKLNTSPRRHQEQNHEAISESHSSEDESLRRFPMVISQNQTVDENGSPRPKPNTQLSQKQLELWEKRPAKLDFLEYNEESIGTSAVSTGLHSVESVESKGLHAGSQRAVLAQRGTAPRFRAGKLAFVEKLKGITRKGSDYCGTKASAGCPESDTEEQSVASPSSPSSRSSSTTSEEASSSQNAQQWKEAMRRTYKTSLDILLDTSKRLVRHLMREEEAVLEVVEVYKKGANKIIERLEEIHGQNLQKYLNEKIKPTRGNLIELCRSISDQSNVNKKALGKMPSIDGLRSTVERNRKGLRRRVDNVIKESDMEGGVRP